MYYVTKSPSKSIKCNDTIEDVSIITFINILINKTNLLLPISDIKIAPLIWLEYNLHQIHVDICKCLPINVSDGISF